MSKREQRRLEAAEHVCRAFRSSLVHAETQDYFVSIAFDWLMVWVQNAPKSIQNTNTPPRRRRTQ